MDEIPSYLSTICRECANYLVSQLDFLIIFSFSDTLGSLSEKGG